VIPVPIETERLVLREWTLDDEPLLAQLFDGEYISLGERTPRGLIERYHSDQREHGFAFYALCTKTGEVIGNVGLKLNEQTGGPEVGWALAADAWGHGYAAESARACIDAVFAHTEHERIIARVDPRNERSLRTAERIGMRRVGELDADVLFEVTRP
jgi:RimJ/RimL family protein N-acetyltransferase